MNLSKSKLLLALLLTATVSSAIAALIVVRTISVTLTVTGSYDLQVYQDAACQTPITELHLGNIARDTTTDMIFYLKNTKAMDAIYWRWHTNPASLPTGISALIYDKDGNILSDNTLRSLAPDAVLELHYKVKTEPTCPAGPASWNLLIEGCSTSSG